MVVKSVSSEAMWIRRCSARAVCIAEIGSGREVTRLASGVGAATAARVVPVERTTVGTTSRVLRPAMAARRVQLRWPKAVRRRRHFVDSDFVMTPATSPSTFYGSSRRRER